MQSILNILSTIYVLVTFFLIKKSNQKINFLKFFTISIVTLLCYNMVVCLLFSVIKIPITLQALFVINILIATIQLIFIIKRKQIQKYSFRKMDAVAIIIILLTVLILAYFNFGKELDIKYIITDASTHFMVAKDFYKSDTLLNYVEKFNISKGFMIGAYTNTGILFKVFAPFIGETNLYKIFILFDIFTFFLVGISIFNAIEKNIKTKLNFTITILMIMLFMCGYPYNSLIYGYVYLQLGILIITNIINVLQYYVENFDKKMLYYLLLLLNFGLFFSYCIFIPIVYTVEFVYIFYKNYKADKKIITLKNLAVIGIIFIIPIVCGLYYIIIPNIISINNNPEKNKAYIFIEGYIYRNCWSNFILLLPIAVLCTKKKNDDTFIWILFTSFQIIFMILYFIAIQKFNLSTYYYYKYNFVLWYLLWYGAIYALNTTEKKINKFITYYIVIYSIIAFIVTLLGNVEITKELFDNDENITNAFDIYGINKTIAIEIQEDYNKEELELLDYIYYNINLDNSSILLVLKQRQEYWFRAFFNYQNRENLETKLSTRDVEKWNNGKYKYLLITYNSLFYETYQKDIKPGRVLIQNKYGIIYENEK